MISFSDLEFIILLHAAFIISETKEVFKMKISDLVAVLLIFAILTGVTTISVRADTLVREDFQLESFSKTVDYFDYVRAYALINDIPTPSGFQDDHAYLYMNYINTSGLQLFYAGLDTLLMEDKGHSGFRCNRSSCITRRIIAAVTFCFFNVSDADGLQRNQQHELSGFAGRERHALGLFQPWVSI